jgi:acylglycerol lipase
MNESTFEGVGGFAIFTRSWQPETAARGVIVIVHGFNSHGGQYVSIAEQFAADGLAVYAIDLRGRGRSEGKRFYIDKFENYANDLNTFVRTAKSQNPGLPIFLLGHSAGGVVSCLYALEYQAEINGLICESFAFQVPAPDFALAALKGLSYVAPHFHSVKLKNEDFSRDPKVVREMDDDPLIKNESQPIETMAELVRADERLKKEFSLIKLPLLILHGTADKAAKFGGSQMFYDAAGSADKTLKLYEGFYHDLLHDVDSEVVLADIRQWIDERIPASNKTAVARGDLK